MISLSISLDYIYISKMIHGPYNAKLSMVLLNPSRQIPEHYLKLGSGPSHILCNSFFSHPTSQRHTMVIAADSDVK